MGKLETPIVVIIDDDSISNHISTLYISHVFQYSETITFTNPLQGIKYISDTYISEKRKDEMVLLLDINMPILSGWDVLDKILELPDYVQRHIKIYMLSSSIAAEDRRKAAEHPLVTEFLEKPLSHEMLEKIKLRL